MPPLFIHVPSSTRQPAPAPQSVSRHEWPDTGSVGGAGAPPATVLQADAATRAQAAGLAGRTNQLLGDQGAAFDALVRNARHHETVFPAKPGYAQAVVAGAESIPDHQRLQVSDDMALDFLTFTQGTEMGDDVRRGRVQPEEALAELALYYLSVHRRPAEGVNAPSASDREQAAGLYGKHIYGVPASRLSAPAMAAEGFRQLDHLVRSGEVKDTRDLGNYFGAYGVTNRDAQRELHGLVHRLWEKPAHDARLAALALRNARNAFDQSFQALLRYESTEQDLEQLLDSVGDDVLPPNERTEYRQAWYEQVFKKTERGDAIPLGLREDVQPKPGQMDEFFKRLDGHGLQLGAHEKFAQTLGQKLNSGEITPVQWQGYVDAINTQREKSFGLLLRRLEQWPEQVVEVGELAEKLLGHWQAQGTATPAFLERVRGELVDAVQGAINQLKVRQAAQGTDGSGAP